ncbi:uncharacterized protein TrAtP1_000890 [Trichoderma atroviride]|uniref:uncharacterized protein n=1 Tax=Hypocrea atroviridis TaxID=63577 RepID=UPI0033230854|nr:hypothetical protein TrAtP1_000890 [Trichoderma atroviride]
MRSLTSISIGIIAGAVTSVARPDAKAFVHNEANELVPTQAVALELRNEAAAATTIVEPAPFKVTLCPQPTGVYEDGPLNLKTEGIFGCQPGYVCNPKKPDGCNFWPGFPEAGFRCNPEDCIVAPPLLLADWQPGKTGYIPHQEGYFYLDPHIFGLTYEIFEYHVVKKIEDGCTSTFTTGNWGPQAQSYGSVPTGSPPSAKRASSPFEQQARRKVNHDAKRQGPTPTQDPPPTQTCMGDCSNALSFLQSNAPNPGFCAPGSIFSQDFDACINCIAPAIGVPTNDIPALESFLGTLGASYTSLFFCNSTNPTSTASSPESQVTGSNTLGTSSQITTAPTSLIQSTTSSSVVSTTSSTKQSTPPPTSSSSKSSTPPPPPPTSSSTKPPPPPPTSSSTKPPPPPTSSSSSSSQQASSPPPSSSSSPSSQQASSPPPSSSSSPSSQQASSTPSSSASIPPSSGAGSSGSSTTGSPGSSSAIGVTPPSSDFSSPGQLERASSTNPGNPGAPGGGAEPTGTNGGGGTPGGLGPTGSPPVGGGNPGGSNPGGVSGTGANPPSPTNSLPPPLSNDLSRPSENFGLLIVALLGLLVF